MAHLRAWADRGCGVLKIPEEDEDQFRAFLSEAGDTGEISAVLEVQVRKEAAKYTNAMVTWHGKKKFFFVTELNAR